MNKYLKKLSPTVTVIAGIIAGVLLLLRPAATLNSVMKILGWGLIAAGASEAVSSFLSGKKTLSDYITSAAFVLGGIVVLLISRKVGRILSVAIGIFLLVSGIYKLIGAFGLKNGRSSAWIAPMVMAGISIAFALFMLIYPAQFTGIILRILGVMILVECAQDLFALKLFK